MKKQTVLKQSAQLVLKGHRICSSMMYVTIHAIIYVDTITPKTTANIELTTSKYECPFSSASMHAILPTNSVPLKPIINAYPVKTKPIMLGKPEVIIPATFVIKAIAL